MHVLETRVIAFFDIIVKQISNVSCEIPAISTNELFIILPAHRIKVENLLCCTRLSHPCDHARLSLLLYKFIILVCLYLGRVQADVMIVKRKSSVH